MTTLEFDSIVLERGSHRYFEAGVCALELAAHLAGEKHSDSPACVSPVLAAFFRNWNDAVDDAFRQKLKPFIPRLLGTADDGKDDRRAWIATDWLIRVCAPAWLDLAKLPQHAIALRTADVISNAKAARGIQPFLDAASAAGVATSEAGVAARNAASAAALDAAVDAARNAAVDAAVDAALDAASAAACAALQTTVEILQASALQLADRLIEAQP